MMTTIGINSLGRYALSLVLCYLEEHEGTSLLISCKRFARNILPMFRLKNKDWLLGLKKVQQHRHRFIEYPAQDQDVLLQRLNTRRLRKRILQRNNSGEEQCYELDKTTKQLAQLANNEQLWPAHLELLRFLTRADKKTGTSLLVSYPRSGNTLLRNLLERLSGIVTGSDNRPDRKLSKDLAIKHNLVGEGVTNCVHIVKTHYPERPGARVQGKRVVLLVRNPYDAIDSYWNLNLTNTHTETVTDDVYQKYQAAFDELAQNEMEVWIRFHRYWLEAPIPVLIVRFEDLISNMEDELLRIAQFLHMDPNRVRHACEHNSSSSTSQLGSYRPRTTGTKPFGKSLEKGRYSDDMIAQFHTIADGLPGWNDQTMLQYFGYDILTQDFPNNFLNQTAAPMVAGPVGGVDESMEVNTGYQIRTKDDKYGRSMKQWRLDRTNKDQDPFPTVQR